MSEVFTQDDVNKACETKCPSGEHYWFNDRCWKMVKAEMADQEAEQLTGSISDWLIHRGFDLSGKMGAINSERDPITSATIFSQFVPVDHILKETPSFVDVEGLREWLRKGCP